MIEPAYTYAEAAPLLRVKESWLRGNIKSLPHTKIGAGKARVTFTETQLEQIRRMFEVQPVGVAELRPIQRRRAS